MHLLSILRGAKCVEGEELMAVFPTLSPKIKRQLGLGHLTPIDLRRKKGRNSHALGTIRTRHTHNLRIQTKRKENNDLHRPATIVWLLYCFGTLDAMCTTSFVSNWKDKKPHKIAMTNALPNCEPITIAIF